MPAIFRVWQNCIYRRCPLGYGGEENGPCSPIKPLDPVDPAIVGRVSVATCWKFARRAGMSSLKPSLALLLENPEPEEDPNALWLDAMTRKSNNVRVGARYQDHLTSLRESGLIKAVDRHSSTCISSYFCVDKDENVARAIFNGKRMSKSCPVPDPVNLVDTSGLVQRVIEFFRKNPHKCFVYGGDFRHWFHQIPAPARLRKLFGLVDADGNEWQWQSIPMGWSWSPLIAQTVAWCTLAFAEENEHQFLDLEAFRQGRLPTWVDIKDRQGRTCGFATVYYDNFVVFCNDGAVAREFQQRIQRNCQPTGKGGLGPVIKPGSEFWRNRETLATKGFEYLGVHFQLDPSCHSLLWWPAKVDTWKKSSGPIASRSGTQMLGTTFREAAQLAGQVIFALMLHQDGLRRSGRDAWLALDCARRIGRGVHIAGGNWDATCGDALDFSGLAAIWNRVIDLPTRPYEVSLDRADQAPNRNTSYVVATDASRSGIGHVLLHRQEDDTILRIPHACRGRPLSAEERNEHIFLLELRAALEGLVEWAGRIPGVDFTLVVDNSAVAFVLRNGFSSNAKAMALLLEPRACAVWHRLADVVLVVSEDNPSDCCSRLNARGAHDSWSVRIDRLERCLAARRRGWNWASRPRGEKDWQSVWDLEAPLRHHEGCPDDDDSILDWCPEVLSG